MPFVPERPRWEMEALEPNPDCESCNCESCGRASELQGGLCPACRLVVGEETIAPNSDGTKPPSSPSGPGHVQASMPKTFGDYDLIEEVARGGMGVVYKALHRQLNRISAIKMIVSGRFSSVEELQRFHIEAEAAAKLDHPGIVPVYEIGEVDGQAFFAMKYIEGGSLADHIGSFRDRPREAMELLAKVVRAVQHAHQRGILHRDLKPANILVDHDGSPLITDLGLAKKTGGGSNLTHTGAVLGTPSYMSPEQASGNSIITTAADIYSLGAIMYELLTGRPPFQGDSAMDIVMKVINSAPEKPSKHRTDVDRDLELICMKCLESNPADRFTAADGLANDLEAWLAGDSISIKAPSIFAQTGRWFRNNQRTAYIGLIVLLGMLVTLPFTLTFLMGSSNNFKDVYSRFPQEQTPFLFSFGQMSTVFDFIALFFLVCLFWPTAGWLNAVIAKPKTKLQAAGIGVLTSSVILIFFYLLVGWMPLIRGATAESSERTKILAEAIWPKDGQDQEVAIQKANELFIGLDQIPESERAEIVANRMTSDQVAAAFEFLGPFSLVCCILCMPIVFGTVIGHILIQRRSRWWLSIMRYGIAWFFSFVIMVILITLIQGGGPMVNGEPAGAGSVSIILAVCSVVVFLTLRRWRRVPNTESHGSQGALSRAT